MYNVIHFQFAELFAGWIVLSEAVYLQKSYQIVVRLWFKMEAFKFTNIHCSTKLLFIASRIKALKDAKT